jgi:hypothetical protein
MLQNDLSKPKPKRRRWLQFSLRTLLVLTLLFALFMGWVASKLNTLRRQQRAAEAIMALGGSVQYRYQFDPANIAAWMGVLSEQNPPASAGG